MVTNGDRKLFGSRRKNPKMNELMNELMYVCTYVRM